MIIFLIHAYLCFIWLYNPRALAKSEYWRRVKSIISVHKFWLGWKLRVNKAYCFQSSEKCPAIYNKSIPIMGKKTLLGYKCCIAVILFFCISILFIYYNGCYLFQKTVNISEVYYNIFAVEHGAWSIHYFF